MKKAAFIISFSALMLVMPPAHSVAQANDGEPSFHSPLGSENFISSSSLDSALSNHGLDQMGHGFLILSIITFLALRKR